MALPSLTKTWQFVSNGVASVNVAQAALGSALTDNRSALLAIKNALIGFATQPWTVVSSSNSVTANSSDNWVTASNLVFAAGAHSWIVLKQTGIGSNFQILIDLTNVSSNGVTATMKYSSSVGFTGGTTTAAPTATDSITFLNAGAWSSLGTDAALRWSVMMSTDGQCTRIFGFTGGVLLCIGMIEKGANATGGTPGASNSGYCATWASTISSFTFAGTTLQNAVACNVVLSYESTANLAIASEVSGAFDIFPIGITCTATVGARGRLFTLQDVWVSSSGIATGDTFPATGSPAAQFIAINNTALTIVLPWNNGAFNLT